MNQLALFPVATSPLPLFQDPQAQAPASRRPLGAPLGVDPAPLLPECIYCGGVADAFPACSPCLADMPAEAQARAEYERRP